MLTAIGETHWLTPDILAKISPFCQLLFLKGDILDKKSPHFEELAHYVLKNWKWGGDDYLNEVIFLVKDIEMVPNEALSKLSKDSKRKFINGEIISVNEKGFAEKANHVVATWFDNCDHEALQLYSSCVDLLEIIKNAIWIKNETLERLPIFTRLELVQELIKDLKLDTYEKKFNHILETWDWNNKEHRQEMLQCLSRDKSFTDEIFEKIPHQAFIKALVDQRLHNYGSNVSLKNFGFLNEFELGECLGQAENASVVSVGVSSRFTDGCARVNLIKREAPENIRFLLVQNPIEEIRPKSLTQFFKGMPGNCPYIKTIAFLSKNGFEELPEKYHSTFKNSEFEFKDNLKIEKEYSTEQFLVFERKK
jgi:hypothetical protein